MRHTSGALVTGFQTGALPILSGAATHVPMVIRRMVGGGIVGFGAQHSHSLEAWFAHVPGLKVVMPSTPYDAKGLLLSAIFDDDPVIHLESIKLLRGIKGDVPLEDYRIDRKSVV